MPTLGASSAWHAVGGCSSDASLVGFLSVGSARVGVAEGGSSSSSSPPMRNMTLWARLLIAALISVAGRASHASAAVPLCGATRHM